MLVVIQDEQVNRGDIRWNILSIQVECYYRNKVKELLKCNYLNKEDEGDVELRIEQETIHTLIYVNRNQNTTS